MTTLPKGLRLALEERYSVARPAVTALQIDVTVPRNTPSGSILLRGANLLPMRGTTLDELDDVLSDQDLLVVDNRITAIGDSGSLAVDGRVSLHPGNGVPGPSKAP